MVMTCWPGGQVSDHADGLADALGQRTLAALSRALAELVTPARSVETARAAADGLAWLPRLERVLPSLVSAASRLSIWVFHSVPAVVCSVVRLVLTVAASVLSLASASGLALRWPSWEMDCRSAVTSGQITEEAAEEGLGDGLLAAVLPPDEQPAPSSAAAATRHAPASPALIHDTLPPAFFYVLCCC